MASSNWFFVQYNIQGGFLSPSLKCTLHLGCQSPVTATFPASFVVTIDSIVGNADFTHDYTFANPTLDPSFCTVTTNSIINLQLDGVATTANLAYFDPSCV